MELSQVQIDQIREKVESSGINMPDLVDSLVDHISCSIENQDNISFHHAFQKAIDAFGIKGLKRVQDETTLLLTLKRKTIMKKTMFVLAYLATILCTSGLLFKLQHWPGASIMLVLGIATLNFGVLPMYFMDRYRQTAS